MDTEQVEDHRLADVDVLVVDDDDAVRSSAAEILRSAGFRTAEAEDGVVALEFLGRASAAVMVLDIRMPRLDGFGLLAALPDPPPVILVSAFDLEERDQDRGKVVAYMRKPLQPRTLLDAVREVLDRSGS